MPPDLLYAYIHVVFTMNLACRSCDRLINTHYVGFIDYKEKKNAQSGTAEVGLYRFLSFKQTPSSVKTWKHPIKKLNFFLEAIISQK